MNLLNTVDFDDAELLRITEPLEDQFIRRIAQLVADGEVVEVIYNGRRSYVVRPTRHGVSIEYSDPY